MLIKLKRAEHETGDTVVITRLSRSSISKSSLQIHSLRSHKDRNTVSCLFQRSIIDITLKILQRSHSIYISLTCVS